MKECKRLYFMVQGSSSDHEMKCNKDYLQVSDEASNFLDYRFKSWFARWFLYQISFLMRIFFD